MTDEVENRYKTSLAGRLPTIRNHALVYATAFDAARTAFENGAWESATADEFHGEMSTKKDTTATVGDDAVAMFETRERREPEEVPTDDWRATFITHRPGHGANIPV